MFLSSSVDMCQDNQRRKREGIFHSIEYVYIKVLGILGCWLKVSYFLGNQNDRIRIGEAQSFPDDPLIDQNVIKNNY